MVNYFLNGHQKIFDVGHIVWFLVVFITIDKYQLSMVVDLCRKSVCRSPWMTGNARFSGLSSRFRSSSANGLCSEGHAAGSPVLMRRRMPPEYKEGPDIQYADQTENVWTVRNEGGRSLR